MTTSWSATRAACGTELTRLADAGATPPATSVFFGGGTPSRLHPELLGAILDAIPRRAGAEVTVECNPEDADQVHLGAYRHAGVTRVSFGLQSTKARTLAGLGRRHVPDAARRIADAVGQAGFATWNLDLIFGGAGESDRDWRSTLDDVLALSAPPPHLSAYALTVESGTPLARDRRRHPDEDMLARRYHETDRVLTGAGYRWEEISNWALPGHDCRHNHLYWDQGDYQGVGSAAHSHRDGVRWWNVRTPERYINAVDQGRTPVAGREVLTPAQRDFEALALALRTPRGVPWEALAHDAELAPLIDHREGRAVLTVRGRLLANEVTARLREVAGVTVP